MFQANPIRSEFPRIARINAEPTQPRLGPAVAPIPAPSTPSTPDGKALLKVHATGFHSLEIWTREEWAALPNHRRPTEAQYSPQGYWIALKLIYSAD